VLDKCLAQAAAAVTVSDFAEVAQFCREVFNPLGSQVAAELDTQVPSL
jgi:hypothetical protein